MQKFSTPFPGPANLAHLQNTWLTCRRAFAPGKAFYGFYDTHSRQIILKRYCLIVDFH
jgi:hypothetical protein